MITFRHGRESKSSCVLDLCMKVDTDIPGHNIRGKSMKKDNWNECADWCKKENVCFGWTYARHKTCYLKSRTFATGHVKKQGPISGPKDCKFASSGRICPILTCLQPPVFLIIHFQHIKEYCEVFSYWSKSEAFVRQVSACPPSVREMSARCPRNIP